jgi:G:T-mismatch repair DNA endonuclease (very short patch repair protein)
MKIQVIPKIISVLLQVPQERKELLSKKLERNQERKEKLLQVLQEKG